ncbi:hypothetical protein KCU81_g8536, partial [Aureobasidium melanogenum]|uniref:Uncharacterized protein n=1 Tax=Aureobasidium melanogenum (strain CBS 110374) TaxID=1043003 RepID=A0A074W737_AURM1
MSAPPSPRSRIPVRSSSCPQSPKPRHLRLLHSGLITIPEGTRQSSADAILTRMPRVRSSDSLYKPVTDKVLPQLPQAEVTLEVTPEAPLNPALDKKAHCNICEEEAKNEVQTIAPVVVETVILEEHAWQEFFVQERTLTRWTISTNLEAAMDATKTQLQNINTARVKHDCLVELCKGISETNAQLQPLCQRAIDQHQALAQKETQLCNASNYVLERNDVLITKCRLFLTNSANSYHKLKAEYNKALAHAKEITKYNTCTCVPKTNDLDKEFGSLTALNKDIGIVTENITSINGLLACHNQDLDSQIASLNAEIIKLASKKAFSFLGKVLCSR